jgi:hypothetical protein
MMRLVWRIVRAKVLFGLFLVVAGAGAMMLISDDPKSDIFSALPGGVAQSLSGRPEGGAKSPGAPQGGSDPLAAFVATVRAIATGEADSLFGMASPREALSTPRGAPGLPSGGGGAGAEARRVAPPQSNGASLDDMFARLAESFGMSGRSGAEASPGQSAGRDAPDEPRQPVILRPGGGSSDGLVQVGR